MAATITATAPAEAPKRMDENIECDPIAAIVYTAIRHKVTRRLASIIY
jgi:hypothetical protein